MVPRRMASELAASLRSFPAVAVIGPRQSGKTTLVRSLFPRFTYLSLERPDIRAQAEEDPNRFLTANRGDLILDEVQRVPQLFSYLQVLIDETIPRRSFVLTGSENFLLSQSISQSLSGRVRIFRLLPFSYGELAVLPTRPEDLDSLLFTGMYPPIYDRSAEPSVWYQSYTETYLERDVRNIKNIASLSLFQRFLTLCAGRIGQLVNLSALAIEAGISHNTAREWLSVLEASYIIHTLKPYHVNYGKRVVKQPKLYFVDTGLVCSLLGIQSADQLRSHYLRGSLFENFVISEYAKHRLNGGVVPRGFFWRDSHGHEIDLLIEEPAPFAVEIKSGETVTAEYFKGLQYWLSLTGASRERSYVIYGGAENQDRKYGRVVAYRNIDEWLAQL